MNDTNKTADDSVKTEHQGLETATFIVKFPEPLVELISVGKSGLMRAGLPVGRCASTGGSVKVNELSGALLDIWVAKAEGAIKTPSTNAETGAYWLLPDGTFAGGECANYSPSTDWSQGGPIIERERLQIDPLRDGAWHAFFWHDGLMSNGFEGDTLLIAAMRAYVASKFGETVPSEVA